MDARQDTKPARYARPSAEQLNAALDHEAAPAVTQESKLQQVANLLKGTPLDDEPRERKEPAPDEGAQNTPAPGSTDEPGPGEGDPEAGEEGSPDEPAQLTIDLVAEKLGLSKDELNKVEVRVGPDTLTLGELKAKLPELAKLETKRVEFDSRVGEWELSKIDTERQILAVVDSFPPGSVPPQVLAAIEQRANRERHKQAGLLNSARPQWGDPKYAEAQRVAINSAMAKYGFSPSELSTVVDHRYVLAMQDFAAALGKLEGLKTAGRKVDESQQRPGMNRAPGPNGAKPHTQTRRRETVDRVAGLLKRG